MLGLQKQLEWILQLRKKHSTTYQRVWFDTPLLRTPSWQSLQILPSVYADVLEHTADWMQSNLETVGDPYHGFKDYEVQRLRRDIAWMREGSKLDAAYLNQQKADFFLFFNEYDKRNKQNFVQVFPDMREWWNECEYHARRS